VVGPGIDDCEHVIWYIADQYVTHLNLHPISSGAAPGRTALFRPELILEVEAYAVVADR
jgi:hypothetical protein